MSWAVKLNRTFKTRELNMKCTDKSQIKTRKLAITQKKCLFLNAKLISLAKLSS